MGRETGSFDALRNTSVIIHGGAGDRLISQHLCCQSPLVEAMGASLAMLL
jgi:hypothetical protein